MKLAKSKVYADFQSECSQRVQIAAPSVGKLNDQFSGEPFLHCVPEDLDHVGQLLETFGAAEPAHRDLADEAGEKVELPGLEPRGLDQVGREGVTDQLEREDLRRPGPAFDYVQGGQGS
jgi:hypothetical protein